MECSCGKELYEEELAAGLFYWICPEHGCVDNMPSLVVLKCKCGSDAMEDSTECFYCKKEREQAADMKCTYKVSNKSKRNAWHTGILNGR